jgi:Bacterial Ig-like domain
MFKKSIILIFSLILISIYSCAKRGSIDGGRKDTIAPVLKMSFPKNGATTVIGNEIKLYFDEYVKLKDVNKQLIISPPMKYTPEILPTTASKSLTIKLKDTLLPNTTYSFNFGQAIEDFNENNPYKQFKFVFSTGKYIDSLKLEGKIKDAYNKDSDHFVSVMLYEVDEKFNDSVVYKKPPRYVTNTLDSLKTFKIENIKAGKYMLLALKDNNNNNKFDPKSEKIGFRKKFIRLPSDTIYELKLFKEEPKNKVLKPKQASGNRLILPYEGKLKNPKIEVKNGTETLKTIVTKFQNKDSLQIWLKPIKTDSLQVFVNNEIFKIKVKEQKKDSLKFEFKQKTELNFRENATIHSDIPLTKIDNSKISIRNKDSVIVNFTTKYDDLNQDLELIFKKEPLEKYNLKLYPGAMTDFLDRTNDTIYYKTSTRNIADYGNLRLVLQNVKSFPIIVALTDDKGKTIYEVYSEKELTINFDLIEPSKYTLRLIYDTDKNKEWNTGNYLQKQQPEQVIYFDKPLDIRANWDVEQVWDCKNE